VDKDAKEAKEAAALVKMARENPYRYFTREEIRKMFNLGADFVASLVKIGAPLAAQKVNPDHLKTWLWENRENVSKLSQ
jgi:hypothetical protein